MFKSKILARFVAIILISVLIISSYEFLRRSVGSFAGSYPFVETWKIDHRIEDVEINLGKLHNTNPDLFKDKTALSLENDHTGHWKKIYFYYSDREEVVQVLIRGRGSFTNVSLLSFTNTKDGKIRLMNKDFNFFENQREKRIFENRVLKYL